jgi:hypothetical protein
MLIYTLPTLVTWFSVLHCRPGEKLWNYDFDEYARRIWQVLEWQNLTACAKSAKFIRMIYTLHCFLAKADIAISTEAYLQLPFWQPCCVPVVPATELQVFAFCKCIYWRCTALLVRGSRDWSPVVSLGIFFRSCWRNHVRKSRKFGALTYRIPKGLLRPVAGKLYLLLIGVIGTWSGIVEARLLAGRFGVRIPVGVTYFSILQSRPDRFWRPNQLPLQWVASSLQAVRRPGHEVNHSPTSRAEVKN